MTAGHLEKYAKHVNNISHSVALAHLASIEHGRRKPENPPEQINISGAVTDADKDYQSN